MSYFFLFLTMPTILPEIQGQIQIPIRWSNHLEKVYVKPYAKSMLSDLIVSILGI